MRKPKAAPHLKDGAATKQDRRRMTAMTHARNRCPGCGTIYRTYSLSVQCENWHVSKA